MYVLGVHCKHDASAALVKDGKLIAMCEEERFTRQKHYFGIPEKSINWILNYANITLEDIDYFAFSAITPSQGKKLLLKYYYLNGTFLLDGWQRIVNNLLDRLLNRNHSNVYKKMENWLANKIPNFNREKIIWVEHHLSHAASAYYASGMKKSAILTFDAYGDMTTTLQAKAENHQIQEIERVYGVNSLGFMYSAFTRYLGYPKGMGHEGKVMGLAAYGEPNEDFSEIIKFNGRKFYTNPKYCYGRYTLNNITKKFGAPWTNSYTPFEKRHANIAATLQYKLEEAALKLVEDTLEKSNSKNLCLAGGVALNCKMNGTINYSKLCDQIFIQPAAGDNGKSLGAALYVSAQFGKKPRKEMTHAYWGPEFSNEEIETALKKNGLSYIQSGDIEGETAELISKGNIVGWFQGRMEIGPRALGNRSVLADPTIADMKNIINQKVKDREFWRPFAPSIIETNADEYFEECKKSRFMIMAFKTLENRKKEIPAVVHIDGTARPQTVVKETNPRYFKLIKELEKINGHPLVLNTSFNEKEPIVLSPENAINTFIKTGLDYLAIGDFLVSKK